MGSDPKPRPKLEVELAEAETQIRSSLERIDETHIALCATAQGLVQRLRDRINLAQNEIATIKDINANWARLATQRLHEAVLASDMKHGDREANMLLSLPDHAEEAYEKWIQEMRLGDTNSDSLVAACRYGMARLRALDRSLAAIAVELSAFSDAGAQACASRVGLMPST